MAKKGQKFASYTPEFKMEAVRLYLEEGLSYQAVAKQLGVPSHTQIRQWVKKYRNGESLEDHRQSSLRKPAWRTGRPKTKFASIKEVIEKKIRFEIIESLRRKYRLSWLLEIAEVSRAGYYKWRKARERAHGLAQQEHVLKEHIMAIHRLRPYYGYLRMTVALRKEGFFINHKRVYRLMRELGIRSVIRRKRRFFGKQASIVYPNRLNRKFSATALNEKWVTDITYLPFNGGFVYLSVIQDLYNNEVLAYHISERNDLSLVLNTLEKACQNRDVTGTLIHSDQGYQYTSKQYQTKLKQLGMLGSHSRKGNCLDNACIESFFSHLKSEMLYFHAPKTLDEFHETIDQYI